MPPDRRPEGDNVTWIPGYWAWDDERSDFLWVSGTWRALPPGRAWMAGYWAKTTQGFQWTSGYWADAAAQATTYLAAPPATIEAGPNIVAPSIDYAWTPGCWLWYQGRYAWGPGYWAQGRSDWDWTPRSLCLDPSRIHLRRWLLGLLGRAARGPLCARPLCARSVCTARLPLLAKHCDRPGRVHGPICSCVRVSTHYYFGDYYAASYYQAGFYTSFSFQSSRHGYDPFYSHQRWEHRSDREWEHRVEASYQYRRDHESARPPRTWAEQRSINPNTAGNKQNHALVAMPIHQLATSKASTLGLQPLASAERQKLAQRGQEVQKSRDLRRTIESKPVETSGRKPGAVRGPAKAPLPRSPIVAKPANQFVRNQAPPKAQQAPNPDLRIQPAGPTVGRQPNADRNHPQPEARQPQSEKKSSPGRSEAKPGAMNTVPAPGLRQASKPAVTALEPQAPGRQNLGRSLEPAPKASSISLSKARQAPAWRAKHELTASEQGRAKPTKSQGKSVAEQPTPPPKPAIPPPVQEAHPRR